MLLDKIKRRLGILDDEQDQLLTDFIEDAESYFKLITSASTIDEKYNFIIVDVVVKRYQRKGSEAMSSESVDGYSVTYAQDDFAEYLQYLEREFGLSNDTRRGRVRFY